METVNQTRGLAATGLASTVITLVDNFVVTGHGDASAWRKAKWLSMPCVSGPDRYATRAKIVYSMTGIYVLVDCVDQKLSCTKMPDMSNLYTQDVVEFFIWPDTKRPLYLEYEISPLNSELVILVPNQQGVFLGWLPWHYEGDRRTRHATSVRGGSRRAGGKVSGWMAEFFLPFSLLTGVACEDPRPGDVWRMNAYRIDYDAGETTHYAWCPKTGSNFHDYENFGVVTFGS